MALSGVEACHWSHLRHMGEGRLYMERYPTNTRMSQILIHNLGICVRTVIAVCLPMFVCMCVCYVHTSITAYVHRRNAFECLYIDTSQRSIDQCIHTYIHTYKLHLTQNPE